MSSKQLVRGMSIANRRPGGENGLKSTALTARPEGDKELAVQGQSAEYRQNDRRRQDGKFGDTTHQALTLCRR